MGRRKKSSLLALLRGYEERNARVRIVCGSNPYYGMIAGGNPEVLMLNIGVADAVIVNLIVAHISAIGEAS